MEKLFEDFVEHKYELTVPWRWKTNPKLGKNLKEIRARLIASETIVLDSYDSIEFVKISSQYFRTHSKYNRFIWSLVNEKSLLIIHPN